MQLLLQHLLQHEILVVYHLMDLLILTYLALTQQVIRTLLELLLLQQRLLLLLIILLMRLYIQHSLMVYLVLKELKLIQD